MLRFKQDFKWDIDEDTQNFIEKTFDKLKWEKDSKSIGYYTLGEDSLSLINDIKRYEEQNDFLLQTDTIVVVGIGGSSLGTKALDSIFRHRNKNIKNMIFLENPDEIYLSEQFKKIKKDKSVFIIVSKSGTTIETISIFKKLIQEYDLDYEDSDKDKIIIITDNDSNLHKFANYYEIKSFLIPSNVGGRFSVLSAVGIVPLTLAGYNTKDILKGASIMKNDFFEKKENHILKKAAFYTKNHRKYPMNVLFSYANCLEDFTKWYVQLWGESLGKTKENGEHISLTPIGHIGSVDQHSFLQLIIEGYRDKSVTFIKLEDFEKDIKIPNIKLKFLEKTDYINGYTFNELIDGECDATKKSIKQQNIPVDLISIGTLNEENIGKLIMYYELLTSACGNMMDINPYNQPGVELGKQILIKKFTQGE